MRFYKSVGLNTTYLLKLKYHSLLEGILSFGLVAMNVKNYHMEYCHYCLPNYFDAVCVVSLCTWLLPGIDLSCSLDECVWSRE